MNKQLVLIVTCIAALSFLLLPGFQTAAAGAEFTLKIGVATPPGHPHTLGAEHLAELLKEKTNGRVEAKVYHSGQLGSNPELLDGVKQGVIDMTVNTPGVMAEYHPVTGLLELPYIFTSLEHRMKVTTGDIGQQIADIYFENTGLKILGYFGGAQRNIITRKKAIETIEDLKGLKMRTWEWNIMIDWWKSLGAIPAVVSFPEVYTALQTGVVDGAENEFTTFDVSKWGEICSYVALTEHNYTVRPLVIGKKQLDKLPADLQQIVIDAGREGSEYAVKLEMELDQKNKEDVKSKFGITYTEPDKKPFIERSLPIIRAFAKEKGITDIAEAIIQLGE